MYQKLFAALLAVVLLACQKNPTQPDLSVDGEVIINSSKIHISLVPFQYTMPKNLHKECMEKSQETTIDCPLIDIYLLETTPSWIADAVNRHITNDDAFSYPKFRLDIDDFVRDYLDNGDVFGKYYWHIEPSLMQTYNQVLQIEVFRDVYSGGVHGMQYWDYLLFDVQLQSRITLKDIMMSDGQDDDKLWSLVEAAYDRHILTFYQKVQPNDKRADTIKIKEHKKHSGFSKTDNVYFSEQGLVFHYNPYHLGSYGEGPIRLVVEFEKLQDILKDEYLPKSLQKGRP